MLTLKERNIEYIECFFSCGVFDDFYFGFLPKYSLEKMTKSKAINEP